MASWAISVLRIRVNMFVWYKFCARSVRWNPSDAAETREIWKSAAERLEQLDALVTQNAPIHYTKRSPDVSMVIATDAAVQGQLASWGMVAFYPASGKMEYSAGQKRIEGSRPSINYWELWAFKAAIQRFPIHKGATIAAYLDNTVALAVVKKQRSSDQQLNSLSLSVARLIDENDWLLFTDWVPSELNPADGLSRGAEWTGEDAAKMYELFKRSVDLVGAEEVGLTVPPSAEVPFNQRRIELRESFSGSRSTHLDKVPSSGCSVAEQH